jgi:PAS domain S-box-containing protein
MVSFCSLFIGGIMSKIAYIAPDEETYQMAIEALTEPFQDIRIEKGLLSEGVRVAKTLVKEGFDVIIARGGTAEHIRRAGLKVSLVEIPYAGFDLVRAVNNAMRVGAPVGVVAFPSMIMGIECLGPVLNVDLMIFPIGNESEAEACVLEAFRRGAKVVIGGVITAQVAKKHSRPHVLINTGLESLLQAAQQAQRIASARKEEKTKNQFFRAILDYAYDGIIAVDQTQRITLFNPVAERITKIAGSDAVGRKISAIWPELRLEAVLKGGTEDLGQILKMHGADILCNKIPIIVNNATAGAVVTCQEVTHIQQMEAMVRRKIFATGHIATFSFPDIVGSSEVLQKTVAIAKKFAETDSSIVITGETGTGKEVFAQSIHTHSKRRSGPFVAINCAALPSQILESELFGYVAGAFTGASQKGKVGLVEQAHDGTLFLDEISEMDYLTQGRLLRVLQEKKVMRLGSDRVLPVNVRVIAATNQNLKELIREKRFRSDLYYRLNVLRLRLHPLRDRKEDIKVLARIFLRQLTQGPKCSLRLSPSALAALTEYAWPGNIRELKNVLECIVAVQTGDIVDGSIIHQMIEEERHEEVGNLLAAHEADELKNALLASKGRHSEAARLLGISRTTLWRRLQRQSRYGLHS